MKRDGWEGGHRVPFIARWPKRIPAGVVSDQLTNTTDIFATLASLVGFELPSNVAVDSFDMLPVLLGMQDDDKQVRPHMVTQSFRGEFQIRKGNWKYLDHQGSGGNNYSWQSNHPPNFFNSYDGFRPGYYGHRPGFHPPPPVPPRGCNNAWPPLHQPM